MDDSVKLAMELRDRNVDLIDCSSGAMVPDAKIPVAQASRYPSPSASSAKQPFAQRSRNDHRARSSGRNNQVGPRGRSPASPRIPQRPILAIARRPRPRTEA